MNNSPLFGLRQGGAPGASGSASGRSARAGRRLVLRAAVVLRHRPCAAAASPSPLQKGELARFGGPPWASAHPTCSVMRSAWEDYGCRVHEIFAPETAAERDCTASPIDAGEISRILSWEKVGGAPLGIADRLSVVHSPCHHGPPCGASSHTGRSEDYAPVASDNAGRQGACLWRMLGQDLKHCG